MYVGCKNIMSSITHGTGVHKLWLGFENHHNRNYGILRSTWGPQTFGNGPRGTSARPQKLSPKNAQCAVMLTLINPRCGNAPNYSDLWECNLLPELYRLPEDFWGVCWINSFLCSVESEDRSEVPPRDPAPRV